MIVKSKLKEFFFERAPNTILEDIIYLELAEFDKNAIQTALSKLIDDNFITAEQLPPNQRFPQLERTTYRITQKALGDYPIKTEIESAGIKVPRLIDADRARAEDVNNLILAVNKIISAKSAELETKIAAIPGGC